MNAVHNVMNDPLAQAVGWALVHFLWQGAIVAGLLALALAVVRHSSANVRYGLAGLALLVMAGLPVGTLAVLAKDGGGSGVLKTRTRDDLSLTAIGAHERIVVTPQTVKHVIGDTSARGKAETPGGNWRRECALWLEEHLAWLVLAWLTGVAALSLRLIGGWLRVRAMVRRQVEPVAREWLECMDELARRMRMSRPVRLLQSMLAAAPMTTGWLRPVILMPAEVLRRLLPEQVKALLAHELAHIRRHDYLVNLVQMLIETLLFHHPAVWWVSRVMRNEREACCDELAARACEDRLVLAQALAQMEELRVVQGFALGARGGMLLSRIQRLVGKKELSRGRAGWAVGPLALLIVTGLMLGVLKEDFIERKAMAGKADGGAATMPTDAEKTAQHSIRHLSLLLYVPYTVKGSDTLESIARKISGDAAAAENIRVAEPGRLRRSSDKTALKPGERLLVPMSAEQRREVRKILEENILPKLKEGVPFEELCRQYSEAEDKEQVITPVTAAGPMLPEINEALSNLKDQEISEIIETQHSLEVIQRVESPARIEKNPRRERMTDMVEDELKQHAPGDKFQKKFLDRVSPEKESGSAYARAMSAVLSFLGTEISYDEVMGLTGVAFILQVDTSGPHVNGELDCAWWPNDAWGFDLGLPVLSKAAGRGLRKLRCDLEAHKSDAAAEYRRAFAPAIEQSLSLGRPLLAEHDHCFIVTGIDGGEPPLLGYGTRGKSTQFEEALRIAGYPWGLIVFGEQSAAVDPVEVDLASLRHIIALYNEQAQGTDAPKTRFSGRQAWAEWLRLLRDGSACDNNMLIHLRYNRRSAVAYLREMVKRHNGGAATHLSAAADLYQRIVDEAMKQGLPYGRVKNGEDEQTVHSEYTAMVERVSRMEAEAITELEAVVRSIAVKP